MSAPDPTRLGSRQPTVDWHVDDTPIEPYELPEIVPATDDADDDRGADGAEVGLAPPSAPPSPGPDDVPTAFPTTDRIDGETAASTRARAAADPADPMEHRTGVQGLGEYVGPVPTEAAAVALRRPGRRPRVRRVTRVLRHVDPWSAFKVGLIFSAVTYVVVLTSGVLLWRVAASTGTLDNVERWFTQFGWETFEFDGEAIFRNARTIGLFGVVAMTGAIVLTVTLFNLVSDIVGGVRMTVLEEEVVERTATSSRRYVVRRTPAAAARATGSGEPAWTVDDGPDPLDLVAERPPVPASADWSIAARTDAGPSPAGADGPDDDLHDDDLHDPVADILATPTAADWSVDDERHDVSGAGAVDGAEEGATVATTERLAEEPAAVRSTPTDLPSAADTGHDPTVDAIDGDPTDGDAGDVAVGDVAVGDVQVDGPATDQVLIGEPLLGVRRDDASAHGSENGNGSPRRSDDVDARQVEDAPAPR